MDSKTSPSAVPVILLAVLAVMTRVAGAHVFGVANAASSITRMTRQTVCTSGLQCINGLCVVDATTGEESCECNAGFTGQYCQCPGGPADDPCVVDFCGPSDAGVCIWDCINVPLCRCNPGFVLAGDGKCVDINECNNPSSCDPNASCSNTQGSFTCTCKQGFQEAADGSCVRVCPGVSDWVTYGDSCYFAPTPRLTPEEARDICHGYGSDLVCNVESAEELLFIAKLTKGTTWLGYSDVGTEGTYTCVFDESDSFVGPAGKPPALSWVELEPNGEGSENCVALAHDQWAAVDCNEEHNFICEFMDPSGAPCPDGWTLFTSNGADSCYWNPPGKASFWQASQFCKLAVPYADLMIIDSPRENHVVGSWNGFLAQDGPTYIGYHRKAADSSEWEWIGQGTPSLATNWLPGMPSNAPGVAECAVLVPSRMMDVVCTEENNFVCRSDVEHPPPRM